MTDTRRCNGVKLVLFYQERKAIATPGVNVFSSSALRDWALRNNHPLEAKETKDGTVLIRMDSNKPWEKLEDWVGNYRQRCYGQAVSECLRLRKILTPEEFDNFLAQITSLEAFRKDQKQMVEEANLTPTVKVPEVTPTAPPAPATKPPVTAEPTFPPRHKTKGRMATQEDLQKILLNEG